MKIANAHTNTCTHKGNLPSFLAWKFHLHSFITADATANATVVVDIVSAVAKSETITHTPKVKKRETRRVREGLNRTHWKEYDWYVLNVAVSLIWVDVKIRCKTQPEIKAIDVDTKHIHRHAHPQYIFNMRMCVLAFVRVCAHVRACAPLHTKIDKR